MSTPTAVNETTAQTLALLDQIAAAAAEMSARLDAFQVPLQQLADRLRANTVIAPAQVGRLDVLFASRDPEVPSTWCSIHECNMSEYSRDGKKWFAHKTEEGWWCHGTQPKRDARRS